MGGEFWETSVVVRQCTYSVSVNPAASSAGVTFIVISSSQCTETGSSLPGTELNSVNMKIGNQAEHFGDVSLLKLPGQLLHVGLVLRPNVLRLFCLNAPFQLTPLLNLHSFIFGVTPIGWLRSVTLNALFLMGISVMIYAHFFRNTSRV